MIATYDGLQFKTHLEAHWAAFFDLVGWKWQVNPAPVDNWCPDFRISFECHHSECHGSHTLLVAVLPFKSMAEFRSHPCLSYSYGMREEGNKTVRIMADSGAAFGVGPTVTEWEMSHGGGGGTENIYMRVQNADELWQKAGRLVVD